MTFLLPITKRRVLPTQTPVHDSRCCKWCFSSPVVSGDSYPPKTLVYDSRCCKRLFFCPLSRGEAYPLKLQCMTRDVRNDISPFHYIGASLTHPITGASLQMLQRFSCSLARVSLTQPTSTAWLQMLQTTFFLPISQRGILPTQTPVHDSRCCKRLFACPLAKGGLTHPNSCAWL